MVTTVLNTLRARVQASDRHLDGSCVKATSSHWVSTMN
jgi:hypothetical protein